jgi:far upstream element-binding protein
VDILITEAQQAPVEAVDPDEVHVRSEESTDNSMALTTIASRFASNSAYRPATVAQLISSNPIHAALDGEDLIEETVNVPNGVVGFLIGRGGETISSMQARSGCKVQIQKEHELVPGQTHRVITLQATSQEAIDQCREMIESMVQDRIRAAGGSASSNGPKDVKVQEALAAGHALVQVDVPDADVGLIIGKAGATIKAIQEQTGAQVQIPPSGSSEKPDTRTVSITHPTEEGAMMAKRRIEDLLNSKPSFSQQEKRPSTGPQITIQIMVRMLRPSSLFACDFSLSNTSPFPDS